MSDERARIPRSREDDYSPEIIAERQAFIEAQTGAKLNHTKQFSYDPHVMSGNIENIWGVSQIPIGIAGPLFVDGEYAKGEFFVPMATVEGTMLASYNRGMKVIRESGGVTTTVSAESMQRAPVFIFADARDARDARGTHHGGARVAPRGGIALAVARRRHEEELRRGPVHLGLVPLHLNNQLLVLKVTAAHALR